VARKVVLEGRDYAVAITAANLSEYLGVPRYRAIQKEEHHEVGLATALASAVTRMPVRRDVAMTGEITLRGKVLPIGGVKEKLLAAHRIGVSTVILPRENEKDLADVPKNVLEGMEVQLVDHIDEVLKIALLPPETPPSRVETGETGDVMGTVPDGMTH
jgi:ATP-dependent Lon protease